MNIGTLIYVVFAVITVMFAAILAGRYLYNRKHLVFIDEIDLKNSPSLVVAKTTVALAYQGLIRKDILKNSATPWDDDAYLRSFVSFLTPENIQAIKSIHVEMPDVQY